MKKCESCGREYPDFWLKCPGCLKTLGQPPEPAQPPRSPSVWPVPLAFVAVGVFVGLPIGLDEPSHAAKLLFCIALNLVFAGSLIWVAWDSGRRDWTRTGRFWPHRVWLWVAAMVLFWPLVFPLYTIARRKAPLRSPVVPEL